MRSSSLAVFGAFAFLLVSASGCRIEARTQTTFENSTQPPKVSVKDWNGEAITIDNAGLNPSTGTAGVEVKVSSTATKVTAEATFAAQADDDKEADAKLSINDAIETLVIDESNGFTVRCGHGKAHGSSSVAASGCKILRVTIPAGTALKAHNLTVSTGAGTIRVGLANAGDSAPFVKNFLLDNNGLGDVDVRIRPVKDATILITGEDSVQVALPSDFSARKVTFTVDEADPSKAAARKSSDFPGMAGDGMPYPPAGASTDAAADLNVNSKGPFDDDTIRIIRF